MSFIVHSPLTPTPSHTAWTEPSMLNADIKSNFLDKMMNTF